MTALIHPFVQVCLLRMRPQDLPFSHLLLGIALVAHTLVSVVGSATAYPLNQAIVAGAVETIVLVTLVAALLLAQSHRERLVQTLTALAGANAVLGFVALPVIGLLPESSDAVNVSGVANVARIVLLVLLCWNVAVMGHVLRHALSIGMAFGMVLSVVFVWLYWSVLDMLNISGSTAAS
ncbi:MAG: hypothetical protein ACR2RL_12255 [Gammaproteobacteria bacterium]